MTKSEAEQLLAQLNDRFSNIHLAIPVPVGHPPEGVEQAIIDIQGMGYGVYIETTAIGDQIVVTDRKFDGNTGFARSAPRQSGSDG